MRRIIDDDLKARALADLQMGETISRVAQRYQVSRTAVQKWQDQGTVAIPAALQEKRLILGRRVAEFLDEGFQTLIAHTRLARDEEWFKRQKADALATYAGVLYDKMAHLIGNIRDVAEDADGDGERVGVDAE